MATTGTAAIAAEVKPLYDAEFYMQAQSLVYWDQLFDLKRVTNGQRGSSVNWPLLASINPNTSQLDELSDVVSQKLSVNELSVTLAEYGGAIDVTLFAEATSYADVYKQAAYANGYNLAESYDFLARAVAGQGSRRIFVGSRTNRTQISGVLNATDRVTAPLIEKMAMFGRRAKMPLYDDGALCTVTDPFIIYDTLQDPGVRQMSQYSHPELLFNGELGYWAGIRLISSANAKAFYGAGAVASSSLVTTTSAAINPGDATIALTSVTNLAVNTYIAIGTPESNSGSTTNDNVWTDTNELMFVTAISGNNVTGYCLDPGVGTNTIGGCRYAHPSGTTVSNSATVFPIVFIGPNSLTKVASDFTGPYGRTVVAGPFDKLGRFLTFGWYAIAGFGRTTESWLYRLEAGCSLV